MLLFKLYILCKQDNYTIDFSTISRKSIEICIDYISGVAYVTKKNPLPWPLFVNQGFYIPKFCYHV